MDSNYDNSDDSSLFLKSLGQKRKASDKVKHKNFKQAKLDLPKSQNSQTDKKEPDIVRGDSNCDDDLMKVIVKDEPKSWKSLENDSESNDSISSYFDEKTWSNSCPLCFKHVETDSGYMTHLKQCAKKRNVTTQQLLAAVELHKKHIEEWKALGLPSLINPPKKSNSKKKVKENAQSDYDLALGLALSKSLDTKESQKSTLQEFGFTYNGPGPSKKTHSFKKWILIERTHEERQRIITEKAAVVLLDENEENNSWNVVANVNSYCRNDSRANFQNRIPRLWNIAQIEENSDWYVNNLKTLMRIIEEEEEETERRICRQISISQEKLTREIEKLKLPKEGIHLDWKKMINNIKFCDKVANTRDLKTVYMHTFILYVRCPDMLERNLEYIFSRHLQSTILIFLEYLYCGTLNGLTSGEFYNVAKLAFCLNHKELMNVLSYIQNNLRAESSEGSIPLSLTLGEELKSEDNEVDIIDVKEVEREDEEVTVVPEEKDLFEEDMIDLTHGSPPPEKQENNEVESNADKSYWYFVQERRREKLKAELRRKEEERERSMISMEMEKIRTSMEQQNEMLQKIYDEFEEEEPDYKKLLAVDEEEEEMKRRSPTPSKSENRSNDSATKDLFEDVQCKEDVVIDCIVLSSDSESRASKGEEEDEKSVPVNITPKLETDMEYEAPFFDPYDNFNDFSNCDFSPVTQHSQSLVSEIAPFSSPLKKTSDEKSAEKVVENPSKGPEYFSTPVTKRKSFSRINSSSYGTRSREKAKKRKSALGASLIIRKSLGLVGKKSKCSSAKKKSKKGRKSSSKRKDLSNVLTDSVLSELSTSLMPKSSTPVQDRFVEMTPRTTRDVDFGESVTPDPNFTNMGDSMLKEHLSKYGLKKSLAKTKARKILRHIYEELHPILNTETGKLVKIVPSDNPKGRKKGKRKSTEKKSNSTKPKKQKKTESATTTATKEPENNVNDGLSKHPDLISDGSVDSFEMSTDYDSDKSEFEDIKEPMTQSVANNPVDLPSALNEFLNRNPEYHQKILLYEPIWLEDLQRQLKEVFRKHFKLSDLMEYLDQKCITFRSEAQKKTNEKKIKKAKKSKQTEAKKELL